MITNKLIFFSNNWLIHSLRNERKTAVTLDPLVTSEHISERKEDIQKTINKHRSACTAIVIAGIVALTLFATKNITEGVLGLFGLVILMSFLVIHYLVYPKELRAQKSSQRYRDEITAELQRKLEANQISHGQIFLTILEKIQRGVNSNNTESIVALIKAINSSEEKRVKIYQIPEEYTHLLNNLEQYFQRNENPEVEKFIQRHGTHVHHEDFAVKNKNGQEVLA